MRTRKPDHDPDEGPRAPVTPKRVRVSDQQRDYFMVGKPNKMSSNQLPTNADVIQHYLSLKEIYGQNKPN